MADAFPSRPTRTRSVLLGLVVLTLPALATPVVAQEEPSTATVVREGDDATRARERVLHLANGHLARGRSRLTEAGWLIEKDGEWVPVAGVQRAEAVKDLLKEADKRSNKLKPTDADGHAVHATWLLSQGLVVECVHQLDHVLRLEPGHHAARELLQRDRLRVQLPPLARPGLTLEEGLRSYMRMAGQLGPAGRALAVRELGAAELPESLDVPAVLAAGLVDASVPTRVFAAQALGPLYPGYAIDPLYRRAILDTQETVRTQAALSLKEVGHEAILLPALKALDSESGAVRTHAADAMALMAFPHAVPALVSALAGPPPIGGSGGVSARGNIVVTNELAYVQDVDVEIAAGASIADPIVGSIAEGVILDARVLGVQMYTIQTQEVHIRRALELITGEKPGRSVKAWQDWWAENETEYLEGLAD